MKVVTAAAAWGDSEEWEEEEKLLVTAGKDHQHTEYT